MKERQTEHQEKMALPMDFTIMKNLKDEISVNLIVLGVIRYTISSGLVHGSESLSIESLPAEDLAYGIKQLIGYWIENHFKIITEAVNKFENMDLVILHNAERALENLKMGERPEDILAEHLRSAIEGLDLILRNLDLTTRDKAARLKTQCQNIQDRLCPC